MAYNKPNEDSAWHSAHDLKTLADELVKATTDAQMQREVARREAERLRQWLRFLAAPRAAEAAISDTSKYPPVQTTRVEDDEP